MLATSPAAKDLTPARPVWMDVQNGEVYPVFDVPRGGGHDGEYTYPDDAKNPYPNTPPKNVWTVDQDGTLIGTAGHVHPGGLRDDLWLQRNGAVVPSDRAKPGTTDTVHLFSSVSHYYEPAGPVSWDVTMSATPEDWRVQVHKGDKLSITATYDSKLATWYEGMGIMVVWMAYGHAGTDPFTTSVNAPGILTRARALHTPTLLLDGDDSPPWMRAGVARLVQAIPEARSHSLAGQTHDVDPAVLAPSLREFFAELGPLPD